MFPNVSEDCTELLFLRLMIVFSVWIWKKRSLTHTSSSQHSTDSASGGPPPYQTTEPPFGEGGHDAAAKEDTRSVEVQEENRRSTSSTGGEEEAAEKTAPSPVSASAGASVVVKAESSSVVNVLAVINSTASDVDFSTDCTPLRTETEKENLACLKLSNQRFLKEFLVSHKDNLKKKIKYIAEGKDTETKILLETVYTQLYITEGDFKEVNKEHEIMKIDEAFRVQKSQEKPINCNEIFSRLEENEENKVVLTKGIAGIGKTVSVQKFILDWAEGEANKDIDCIFFLPFREINLIKVKECSLHELLQEFYPELEKLSETNLYKNLKLAFVFDGLDESRPPLEFSDCMVSSEQKKAPVNALITNMIKGNLLPSALIWITSRPAAANQIPSQHVGLFTEVRGFTDKQKEEYFKKRIPDVNCASKIISQVKTSRSLYIMCHIPIFCWITARVLQEMLQENTDEEIPTTLTEMYIHFLLIQIHRKSQKYDGKVERDLKKLLEMNREMILKLAKLAFEQLKKGNILFYEDDLMECGIEVSGDSEYTGMCAEIFKKESVLHERKVYCFIHLSIQEFLAALHVFNSYLNKNMEELQFFFNDRPPKDTQLEVLLKKAVDKATECENGHLDLFLRFLLGISPETNQKLLQGVLTHTQVTKKSINKVIQFIRQKQNNDHGLPPETSINHFFCLMELKDSSLYNQIKNYLYTDKFPDRELSPSNCSALAYLILMSEDILEELDLKKFNSSNNACRRLIPAVRCCRKARLAGCELTEMCWETVVSALEAENSVLTELDLSDNYRVEKGAKLLSDGLRSSHCKLEVLRLASCHFSQSSCAELASALASVSSSLSELDLSNNDLQDTGLEQLFAGCENSFSKLQILRLSWCNLTEKSCSFLSSVLNTLRELDLSNNDLQDSGVKLLSEGLSNEQCKLQILRLSGCIVTQEGFSFLASALSSNSLSVLSDLDLSYNNPGDEGERLLSDLLKNSSCKLETLVMEPKSEQYIKAGIKKYACELTFDPNTANKHLCLSEVNRKVSYTAQAQQYPDHPERFEMYEQVLCNESLNHRCYWEVYCESSSSDIGITYSSIGRKSEDIPVLDNQVKLGLNEVSWVLTCTNKRYTVQHSSEALDINMPASDRIGVYLDWPAGRLSFYRVSPDAHTLAHMHTICTVFKNPVYPAFGVENGSVTLCQLD
ncbi:NACHT, LRR and PYD domains-containing protein 12-like isoform X2 [Neoarius graeffei]|uniref:NACHT, LRR and PYD domains-containing protein 12-like isoform X2 n=1 Tax=Neoarius graeffei TaxID=443677 RepID=UPI00298C5455|nr:NACHT, LRR and PYD domains-containing protein 12-like isoform X2 [Neoarius graeffei]